MMTALGVRCWKDKIALVVLEDVPGSEPRIVLHRRSKLAVTSDGDRVRWVHQAVIEAIQEGNASTVAVRISDDFHADQRRAEHEGVALHAGAALNLEVVTMRRQSMLKPLGVPPGKGMWADFQRANPFVGQFVADERDAAMAARSVLGRGTTR